MPSLPISATTDNEANVEADVEAKDDVSPPEDRRGANDSQSPQFQLLPVEDATASCRRMDGSGNRGDAGDGRRSVTLFRGRRYAPAATVPAANNTFIVSPSKTYSLPQWYAFMSRTLA